MFLTAMLTGTARSQAAGPGDNTSPATSTAAERRAERRAALFAALEQTESEAEARVIEEAIWKLWFTAPDSRAQSLIDAARERRRGGDLSGAIYALDELIADYPDYAEGWNQRATLYYMQGNFQDSLADVEEVLAREPRHFGALSGKVLILMRLGQTRDA